MLVPPRAGCEAFSQPSYQAAGLPLGTLESRPITAKVGCQPFSEENIPGPGSGSCGQGSKLAPEARRPQDLSLLKLPWQKAFPLSLKNGGRFVLTQIISLARSFWMQRSGWHQNCEWPVLAFPRPERGGHITSGEELPRPDLWGTQSLPHTVTFPGPSPHVPAATYCSLPRCRRSSPPSPVVRAELWAPRAVQHSQAGGQGPLGSFHSFL